MVSSWEPWKWLSTTVTCFPGNLSRERHFYNWRQSFCPTLTIIAFPLFQFCFSFTIYSQHSSPGGKFESFTWSHKMADTSHTTFFPLPPWFPHFSYLYHILTQEVNCWLIFDVTLSLRQAPNSHHKHSLSFLFAFPSPLHSFRPSSHAPWPTVLGHRLCPSWSTSFTVPSWDNACPCSPSFPSCRSKSAAPILPSPSGPSLASRFPHSCPSQLGGHPPACFSLAPALHTPARTQCSPVPHQGRGLPAKKNIQGEAAWGQEWVWAPESDPLVSFQLCEPRQISSPGTSCPVRNTVPAAWRFCGAGLTALPTGGCFVRAAWCCNYLWQGLLGAEGSPTCTP